MFETSDNEKRYLYKVPYLIITEFVCTNLPSPSLPEERLYVGWTVYMLLIMTAHGQNSGWNFTANMKKVNDGYPFGHESAVRASMNVKNRQKTRTRVAYIAAGRHLHACNIIRAENAMLVHISHSAMKTNF